MSKLFEVTIEVTQRCPNKCIYCSSLSSLEKNQILDLDTIYSVVDDAAELGAKQINLSGGEPLLRPDIVEIADYIHSKGLNTRLYSSGIYYDGTYRSLPIDLITSLSGRIDYLIFNYETLQPDLYGQIMGTAPGNLFLLEESIQRSIRAGIPVEAHLVPMKCNFRMIPQSLERLYSIGVSNVSLLRLVPQGRVDDNTTLTKLSSEEEAELRLMQKKLSAQYGEKLRLGKPYRTKKFSSCMTGSIRLAVRYDGYVFPCGAFKDGVMTYGGSKPDNVREKRLKEIYETSEYIAKIREGLAHYYEGEVTEPCYGQFYRSIKKNDNGV